MLTQNITASVRRLLYHSPLCPLLRTAYAFNLFTLFKAQRYFSPHSFFSSPPSSLHCPFIYAADLDSQLSSGFTSPRHSPLLFSPPCPFVRPTCSYFFSLHRLSAPHPPSSPLPVSCHPFLTSQSTPSFLLPPSSPPACQPSSHRPGSPSDDCRTHFI